MCRARVTNGGDRVCARRQIFARPPSPAAAYLLPHRPTRGRGTGRGSGELLKYYGDERPGEISRDASVRPLARTARGRHVRLNDRALRPPRITGLRVLYAVYDV